MEDLVTALENRDIHFEIIRHEKPIYSAQEGANYFDIEIGQTAPTLILKTDKGFFALIVSGSRGRVDLDEIGKILGCTKVKLAGGKEVLKVTGYSVGSVALVGHNLPCIIDKQLYRYPFIYGGTGEPTCTLKIGADALEKLNQVVAVLE